MKNIYQIIVVFAVGLCFVSQSYAGVKTFKKNYDYLCPTHISGDREYAGNGPEVDTTIKITKNSGSTAMYLKVYMDQLETKADWTGCRINRTLNTVYAPSGTKFYKIWNDETDQWLTFSQSKTTVVQWDDYFIDRNHDPMIYNDGSLPYWLDKVSINGDTKGKDVGNCTLDDAWISIRLDDVNVMYY